MSATVKKAIKKHVGSVGTAHIKATFNNTIVSIADTSGNVIVWASSGNVGFKGTKKGTPFAAQLAAESAAKKALEFGMRRVDVYVNGPGGGRETAIRQLQTAGLEISSIRDEFLPFIIKRRMKRKLYLRIMRDLRN